MVRFLTGLGPVRRIARLMRLDRLGRWWLVRRPIVRSRDGIRYRMTRLEAFALANEMFNGDLYPAEVIPNDLQTFADLGCNVGYFSCWVCMRLQRPLRGLLVDANQELVTDAQWHMETNGQAKVKALCGLLGQPKGQAAGEFYLHPSSVVSTAFPTGESAWKKIEVPAIDFSAHWRQQVGDVPCDLLKLDIEGSELDFIANEAEFMGRVKTAIVEWHKFRVSLDALSAAMAPHGLVLARVLDENENFGTAHYVKKP